MGSHPLRLADAGAVLLPASELSILKPMLRLSKAGRRNSTVLAVLLSLALLMPDFMAFAHADNARGYQVSSQSGNNPIAVIYPDISEPYRTVFAQIIAGIEDKTNMRAVSYAVGSNVDGGELKNALSRQDAKVVIALGRQGMKIAGTLDRNIGVVVGGVITAPEQDPRNFPLISMSPDPALLFAQLKQLSPGMRRVFTVYDPHQNDWLIQRAKAAAGKQGLELVAYEAQDLRGAVSRYQEIFAAADNRQDALWLLQDSTTVEDSSVLPLVLQESWGRGLTVFSSSFGHVKRGVLFSLYPDNNKLGRHLAEMALAFLDSGDYGERGMILLREVLTAVNLRTAKHLGVNASRQQDFDMAFPDE
jgi:putative tryptophan/tyrosine transport system substrate-binding protein